LAKATSMGIERSIGIQGVTVAAERSEDDLDAGVVMGSARGLVWSVTPGAHESRRRSIGWGRDRDEANGAVTTPARRGA
jgi:hypothetical protein